MIAKRIKNIINDMDKPLLIVTIIMIVFGLLNIVTVSSREAVSLGVPLYYYFYRHSIMLIIGLFLCFIVIKSPTIFYKKVGIGPMILIAIYMFFSLLFAQEVRGAANWSNIFGFSFQPSEFVKVLGIATLASLYDLYFHKTKNRKGKHLDIIIKIIIVTILVPIIVFVQKDFGTMFIQLVIFLSMFLFSPIKKQEKIQTLGILGVIFVLGLIVLFFSKGYIFTNAQMARFDGFLHPCENYEEGGYQVCNALIAINDGGLFGLGIGKSKQKYSYIPEPHTDFVFSIIVEEYGFLRVTLIFMAYIFILYRVMRLACLANTIRGRYICFGVGVYLFSHMFINLGGLLALIPLTGVPLPFLSYGGSYTISLLVSMALVQRVHIELRNKKIKIR